MTKVKICGLRCEDDITYVNETLPDYIGFVFARSKRQVSLREACKLAALLDRRIKKVGVFVDENIQTVVKTVEECGLDVIQLHGDEDINYISDVKNRLPEILKSKNSIEIWKAIKIQSEEDIDKMSKYDTDAFLLDTYSAGSSGGTGRTFDWNIAVKGKKYGSIVLAGGLNCNNVKSAIDKVKPYCVDVSSGVETDGRKDRDKIKVFIDTVRKS